MNVTLNDYEQLVYRRMAERGNWLTEKEISRLVSLSDQDVSTIVGSLHLKGAIRIRVDSNGLKCWKTNSNVNVQSFI